MRFARLFAVAQVELLRLLRSRMTLTLLLIVPVLQVLLFGYAIRPEAASVSVAVAAPTAAAAKPLIEALKGRQDLRLDPKIYEIGGAEMAVKSGNALIGIEIPVSPSFANPFAAHLPARLIVDATNPTLTAAPVARLEGQYWKNLAERSDAAGPKLSVERLYNPTGRADWTFIPSLVGVTVMIAMIMLGSLTVSREREGGTWETLQSMPIDDAPLLLGKILPGTILGTIQGIFILLIGYGWFGLPWHNSVLILVLALPFFAAAHLLIGLAISTRAASQLAALQGAVAFYLPAMLLSGFLYPFETLPRWAQWVGSAFPLTHFIRAAHSAVLKGSEGGVVFSQVSPIVLCIFGAILLAKWGLSASSD